MELNKTQWAKYRIQFKNSNTFRQTVLFLSNNVWQPYYSRLAPLLSWKILINETEGEQKVTWK